MDLIIGRFQSGKDIRAVPGMELILYQLDEELIAVILQHQIQQEVTDVLFLSFDADAVVVLAVQGDVIDVHIVGEGQQILVDRRPADIELFAQVHRCGSCHRRQAACR